MSALEDIQKANLTATTSSTEGRNAVTDTYASLGTATEINTGASGGFLGIGADAGTTLVGMNTDEASVNAILTGIDNYINPVKDDLAKLAELETAAQAFGPEVGTKVQAFTSSMKEACNSIVSQLLRFKADVKTVAETYRAKGESVITAVGQTTSTITDAASSAKYEFENGSN